MTQRERNLLMIVLVLGGLVVLVVGYFGLQGVLDTFAEKDRQIEALELEVRTQTAKLKDLAQTQARLEQWRAISLPADPQLASSRYRPFLDELLNRHQLRKRSMTEGGNLSSRTIRPGANVNITPLTYQLQLDGTLARLIGFLKEFYSLNLPHSIRELSITPQGTGPDARLDIQMRIEALYLPNATNRDFLVAVPDSRLLALDVFMAMKHGPIGMGLAPWLISPTGLHGARKLASDHYTDRDYTKLVSKNVFVGLAAPPSAESAAQETPRGDREVLKYVQLSGITGDFLKTEAVLRNRLTGKFIRLRSEGGFDTFTIKDANDREVLKGKVKHIDRADVVIQVDDKLYGIHAGEFLEQALRKELTPEQLKALGIVANATGENP